MPTVKAIYGNAIAPGYADRKLAEIGYDAQQTDEPEDPARPDNLWSPVPGDWAAHGRFDARAKRSSAEVWASMHRSMLGAAGAGLAALALAAVLRLR
jgi:hypothetical protein